MSKPPTETRSVVIERELPHPPDKVWRALTQSALLDEWLMKNDFQLIAGHRFNFRSTAGPQWNGVVDCQVLMVEPHKRLSYSWNSSGADAANGMKTVVTWTLTPTKSGVLLRMEQTGFRPEDEDFFRGANYGWQKMLGGLEQVLARID